MTDTYVASTERALTALDEAIVYLRSLDSSLNVDACLDAIRTAQDQLIRLDVMVEEASERLDEQREVIRHFDPYDT